MNRRRFIGLTLGGCGLAALWTKVLPPGLHRVEHRSWALGAEVSLVVYHEDRTTADRGAIAAFKALDDLENVLSLYRPHSQICRLNREGSLDQAHPDLVSLLQRALEWSSLTAGAFDPTVQPLWILHQRGQPVRASELDSVRRLVDWRQVHLDGKRIRLGPGQSITLNGIAQGFAADRVRDILRAHGIQHALANTGEYGALGSKPKEQPWRIGIQHPRLRDAYVTLAALEDRSLATSGDYETTFDAEFKNHHIFDPATGRSPTDLSSVTVLASSALEADVLSTAAFVLGPSRGLEFAARRAGVDALLVLKDGNVLATPNFPRIA